MNFDVVKAAGLTYADVADIVGVSRVSMSKYKNGSPMSGGKSRGKKNVQLHITVLMSILTKLVSNGTLPRKDMDYCPRMTDEVRAARAKLKERLKQLMQERVANAQTNK